GARPPPPPGRRREGLLKVTVAKAVPLERAPEAHQEVETGHVRGKVVPTVGRRPHAGRVRIERTGIPWEADSARA
ncbi:zinc-binding dehydrogenase, partial [Kitasatospora herbaricolor]|uniref:zinc-binding dehydrogenase n=1 Tax=Kitasatospora herbaricolor TaxID=68217 RepID=UPI0036DB2998